MSGDESFIVRARGLCRHFDTAAGRLEVLRGIDLDVARGQTLAVVGESGSGKSTLLGLLAGLDAPDAGSLVVADRHLTDADEDALADFRARTVGIVFQHFHLMASLTALENVRLPLELRDGGDGDGRAEQALAMVGLTDRRDHFPAQLSGGERQRVAIARAVVTDPELLLADEPTGNLDERTGAVVADLLFDLVAARRTTLVLVTHSREMAARCQRELRLSAGRFTDEPGGATAAR